MSSAFHTLRFTCSHIKQSVFWYSATWSWENFIQFFSTILLTDSNLVDVPGTCITSIMVLITSLLCLFKYITIWPLPSAISFSLFFRVNTCFVRYSNQSVLIVKHVVPELIYQSSSWILVISNTVCSVDLPCSRFFFFLLCYFVTLWLIMTWLKGNFCTSKLQHKYFYFTILFSVSRLMFSCSSFNFTDSLVIFAPQLPSAIIAGLCSDGNSFSMIHIN